VTEVGLHLAFIMQQAKFRTVTQFAFCRFALPRFGSEPASPVVSHKQLTLKGNAPQSILKIAVSATDRHAYCALLIRQAARIGKTIS